MNVLDHADKRKVKYGAIPPPPAFGLIYEGAIGQPRWTTSLWLPPYV